CLLNPFRELEVTCAPSPEIEHTIHRLENSLSDHVSIRPSSRNPAAHSIVPRSRRFGSRIADMQSPLFSQSRQVSLQESVFHKTAMHQQPPSSDISKAS